MKKLVHKHLLVKAYIQNPPKSEAHLNAWLTELVKVIEMNICIEPRSYYVATPGNRGITGQVGLSTSHSTCHVWDEFAPAFLQFDLYSCADYSTDEVIKKISDFGIISYELMLIDRDDGFKVLEHSKSAEPQNFQKPASAEERILN